MIFPWFFINLLIEKFLHLKKKNAIILFPCSKVYLSAFSMEKPNDTFI